MAWTNPGDGQSLDLTTGQLVEETHWDAIRRNLYELGGSDGYSGTVRRLAVVSKTANYTATNTDDVILVDASAGAVTISLPTAVGIAGRSYHVKKTDSSANAVIVDPNGTETIDGQATTSLTSQYETLSVESNGANWVRLPNVLPADQSITSRKLNLDHASAQVAARETTTSTTYTDLATAGPSVTVSPGVTQDYLILLQAIGGQSGASGRTFMSVSVGGAAASDGDAAQSGVLADESICGVTIATNVPSGTTFTAKYRVASGTGVWEQRRLCAIAI